MYYAGEVEWEDASLCRLKSPQGILRCPASRAVYSNNRYATHFAYNAELGHSIIQSGYKSLCGQVRCGPLPRPGTWDKRSDRISLFTDGGVFFIDAYNEDVCYPLISMWRPHDEVGWYHSGAANAVFLDLHADSHRPQASDGKMILEYFPHYYTHYESW